MAEPAGETLTVLVVALPALALQVYVVAPPPVSKALLPAQIVVGVATAVTVGSGLTVTATVAVLLQLSEVPVTVYTLLVAGETETVDVVALPAFALQVYVVAPPPVSMALCPVQIAVGVETAVTVGVGFIVTVDDAVEVQPPTVPVTVYIVVPGGFAVTLAPDVALNPVEGVQLYVLAPDAVNVVPAPPEHIAGLFTATVGFGPIVKTYVPVTEPQPELAGGVKV